MREEKSHRNRILGGLWGAIVGDALGLPAKLSTREKREQDPVTSMRGYGTYYQPPGTWWHNSSLLLCTVESLANYRLDLHDMGQRFVRWHRKGYWTPWGEVADIGDTTQKAIDHLEKGVEPVMAGDTDVNSNDNESLIRMLPIALRFANSPPDDLLNNVYRVSSLTHRHPRSLIACGFYSLIASALMKGLHPLEAYKSTLGTASKAYTRPPYLAEMAAFKRFVSGQIHELPESEIQSGCYVVDTLEASVWCLLNSSSFEETVLKAANLGGDTDTTACVTGGLAGIHNGLSAVPAKWIGVLAKRDDIGKLFDRFVEKAPS